MHIYDALVNKDHFRDMNKNDDEHENMHHKWVHDLDTMKYDIIKE